MRVTGGRLRGRQLAVPAGRDVRPTTDRVREALFNIVQHAAWAGSVLDGAIVLDAFCGTGALGIEALSRGAARAWFMDTSPASLAIAQRNASALGLDDQASFLRADATRPPPAQAAATLVFLDPPYRQGLSNAALSALAAAGWIAPGAIIASEGDTRDPAVAAPGFTDIDERRYGTTRLSFLARSGQPTPR